MRDFCAQHEFMSFGHDACVTYKFWIADVGLRSQRVNIQVYLVSYTKVRRHCAGQIEGMHVGQQPEQEHAHRLRSPDHRSLQSIGHAAFRMSLRRATDGTAFSGRIIII
jgi:hypothetical protein